MHQLFTELLLHKLQLQHQFTEDNTESLDLVLMVLSTILDNTSIKAVITGELIEIISPHNVSVSMFTLPNVSTYNTHSCLK